MRLVVHKHSNVTDRTSASSSPHVLPALYKYGLMNNSREVCVDLSDVVSYVGTRLAALTGVGDLYSPCRHVTCASLTPSGHQQLNSAVAPFYTYNGLLQCNHSYSYIFVKRRPLSRYKKVLLKCIEYNFNSSFLLFLSVR